MKLAKAILILTPLLVVTPVFSQENKDLYYAQPPNTGLYLGFIYLNSDNFVLAGVNDLYLFDSKRLLVDSLQLSSGKKSFLDNVNHANVVGKGVLSVSTLQRSMLISVENNAFKILEDYTVKEQQKKFGKYDLFILTQHGVICRAAYKNGHGHYYFSKSAAVNNPLQNLTPASPQVTRFKGSEIFGFSKYQFLGDNVFLFNRRQNTLSIFDETQASLRKVALPEVDSENQANEFYVDPIGGKCYLVQLNHLGDSKIYSFSLSDGSFKLIASTKHIVRGVFNGNIYVSGVFDGVVAHYLIPLHGQNPEIIFVDEEK